LKAVGTFDLKAQCQDLARERTRTSVRPADSTLRFVKVQPGRSQAARLPQAVRQTECIYRCPLLLRQIEMTEEI
jgi:hypothetical protein